MAKTLKDLFLALLNATLILVALCLVLLVLLTGRIQALSDAFAEHLTVVDPLTQNLRDAGAEIAALRGDLAALRDRSRDLSPDGMMRIDARAARIETRLADMQGALDRLRDVPGTLLTRAIDHTADRTVAGVARLRGCVPADQPPGG